jgi:hypothetical protein
LGRLPGQLMALQYFTDYDVRIDVYIIFKRKGKGRMRISRILCISLVQFASKFASSCAADLWGLSIVLVLRDSERNGDQRSITDSTKGMFLLLACQQLRS